MSNASDVRNIASEARLIMARQLDDALILKGLSAVCREKGIDWGQLKALVKAQEQDHRDGGDRVGKIVQKADFAAAYAELLAGHMNENLSGEKTRSSSRQPLVVVGLDEDDEPREERRLQLARAGYDDYEDGAASKPIPDPSSDIPDSLQLMAVPPIQIAMHLAWPHR